MLRALLASLNEGGRITPRSLAAKTYSLTLCFGGIIVMMMMVFLPDTRLGAFHTFYLIMTVTLQGSSCPHLQMRQWWYRKIE